MNTFEQLIALAAIAVSGVGIRTIIATIALRRRLK